MKTVHVTCALASGAGFALRAVWMAIDSPRLRARPTRILPHLIDTLLLAAALGLLWGYGWNPFDQAWLNAKILALLAYIALGALALRPGRPRPLRGLAATAALMVLGYIFAVAATRQADLGLAGPGGALTVVG